MGGGAESILHDDLLKEMRAPELVQACFELFLYLCMLCQVDLFVQEHLLTGVRLYTYSHTHSHAHVRTPTPL